MKLYDSDEIVVKTETTEYSCVDRREYISTRKYDHKLNSGKSDKNYDRSVCFTMYRNWVEIGYEIEEAFGIEASLTWRKFIENYCLYGNAPEWESLPKEYALVLKLAWIGIQGNVDAELAKRKKYFKEEELNDQQRAVIQYMVEHHESSGRACAKALGLNPSTVNNWLRNKSFKALIYQK